MKNETHVETRGTGKTVLSIVKTEHGYSLDCDEQWFANKFDVVSRILLETFNHLSQASSSPKTPNQTINALAQTATGISPSFPEDLMNLSQFLHCPWCWSQLAADNFCPCCCTEITDPMLGEEWESALPNAEFLAPIMGRSH